jgi:hypothetical protein
MSKTKNLVIQSLNMPGDQVCVDLFQRPDGSYGFEEYRRDSEDGRGWFPIGHYAHRIFERIEDAKKDAVASVGWLDGFA